MRSNNQFFHIFLRVANVFKMSAFQIFARDSKRLTNIKLQARNEMTLITSLCNESIHS